MRTSGIYYRNNRPVCDGLEKRAVMVYHHTGKAMKHALVLYSGGIDSTTALYWAKKEFDRVSALTIDYGQRHKIEVRLAEKIVHGLELDQKILRFDLTQVGGSALTDTRMALPMITHRDQIDAGPPPTYVPFRNGIFLALAAAWAEVIKAGDIVCGFNIVDSPEYPDTRPAFVEAMEKAVNLGTRAAFEEWDFKIHSPFIQKKKSEIINLGLSLGADYSFSVSCYSGQEIPCEKCSSCLLRHQAWEEAGREDPLITRLRKEGRL